MFIVPMVMLIVLQFKRENVVKMKKLLGIVVLGLLLCTSTYAKNLTFKPGSGPLKLSENTVKIFYIYLTEKLSEDNFQSWSSTFSEENFKAKKVPGSYCRNFCEQRWP